MSSDKRRAMLSSSTARCTTGSRPSATPNSADSKHPARFGSQPHSPKCSRASFFRPSEAPSLASMSQCGGACLIALSTWRPPTAKPPARCARPIKSRQRRASSRSVVADKSDGASTARFKLRAKPPRRAAVSMLARSARTQTPRPGSLAAISGAITPSGDTANRMSWSSGRESPVAAQRRERPLPGASSVSDMPLYALPGRGRQSGRCLPSRNGCAGANRGASSKLRGGGGTASSLMADAKYVIAVRRPFSV